MISTAAAVLLALALGVLLGRGPLRQRLREPERSALPPGAGTPVAQLVEGFREYAALVDGGVSEEVEVALAKLDAEERTLKGADQDLFAADLDNSASPSWRAGTSGATCSRWTYGSTCWFTPTTRTGATATARCSMNKTPASPRRSHRP